MADSERAAKLAKRIVQIVANTIEQHIRDSRLDFITITDAKVTADLREATVYYTVFSGDINTEPDTEATAHALERYRGQLRTAVGQQTGIRYTPSLQFRLDQLPDTAKDMEEAIARAKARDADIAKAAQNAKPAGDSQPYKIKE